MMTFPDAESRRVYIEQLRARVEARQAQKEREQGLQYVTDCLETTPSLAFLGFLDEALAMVEPGPVFRRLSRYAETATSALYHEASTEEQERQWLGACLAQSGMMERFSLSLSFALPWAEVQILDPHLHLYPVWSDLYPRDLVLLSHDRTRVLVLIEAEHEYLAFIREVKGLLPGDGNLEPFDAKIHRFQFM